MGFSDIDELLLFVFLSEIGGDQLVMLTSSYMSDNFPSSFHTQHDFLVFNFLDIQC